MLPADFSHFGLAHPPDKSPNPTTDGTTRRRGTDLAGYMLSWRVQLMKQPRKKTWKKPRRWKSRDPKDVEFWDFFMMVLLEAHDDSGIGWCESFVERWFQIWSWPNSGPNMTKQLWMFTKWWSNRCMMEISAELPSILRCFPQIHCTGSNNPINIYQL